MLPGTQVDVLATASPTDKREDIMTKLVLSNVRVLAAGMRMERDQEGGEPVQVSVVTLQVTPGEAERLTLASTEGKIQLALRNPMDQGEPETSGIKPARPARRSPAGSASGGAPSAARTAAAADRRSDPRQRARSRHRALARRKT